MKKVYCDKCDKEVDEKEVGFVTLTNKTTKDKEFKELCPECDGKFNKLLEKQDKELRKFFERKVKKGEG